MGTVDVTITTSIGTSASSSSDQFTYTNVPVVISLSPLGGPRLSGTVVTITGANFSGSTAVEFGTVLGTNLTVVSSTEIIVTSPAESTGTVNVTVTNTSGTSATNSSDQFIYTDLPYVEGVSPTSGPLAGGTSVTIDGFNLTTISAIDFGTNAATLSSLVFNANGSITVTDQRVQPAL